LHAFDTQHFSARIKNIGDSVGVKHHAIAAVQIDVESDLRTNGFGQGAQNHAARLEQARLFAIAHDQAWRMSCARKDHASAATIYARGGHREEEDGAAYVVHDETVEMAQHHVEACAGTKLGHHLGVDAIGHERRADTVAGNVADQQVQVVFVECADQSEVSADGAHRMVEGFDVHAAPHDGFGRQALLDACGKGKIFLDFLIAVLQLPVRDSQFLLDPLYFRNVGERDDGIAAAFGILNDTRADDDGQTAAILARQHELKAIFPVALIALALQYDEIRFFLGVDVINVEPDELAAGHSGHFFEIGIGKNDGLALIGDEHTFVQAFEDAFNLK
jgi:hypothetical protein